MAPGPAPTGPISCSDEQRRHVVATGTTFNGLDYVEVDTADQRVLHVGFLHPVPGQMGGIPAGPALTAGNVLIQGGERVSGIEVTSAVAAGTVVTVTVDAAGDFSQYRLRLVRSAVDLRAPVGFDPVLAAASFSFKANCPSDLDCASPPRRSEPVAVEPALYYLAKDYGGLRGLLLDRVATLSPDATDRNPADPIVTVVEALAHLGDRLSYRQDAVATEAYLGTARSRISVRRHARLLDYAVHDGAAARTWARVEVAAGSSAETQGIPAGTPVISGGTGDVVLAPAAFGPAIAGGAVAFVTLTDLAPLAARNRIPIHTWSGRSCCLPVGATEASLVDNPPLQLGAGDLVMFQEVAGPVTGRPADADRTHRQVVRLVTVTPTDDPVEGVALLDVTWAAADGLRFPLQVSAVVPGAGTGTEVTCGVARGNLVAAQHGVAQIADLAPVPGSPRWRPLLTTALLACAQPAATSGPAAAALVQDPRAALPLVRLVDDAGATWEPRRDLLASDRFDHGFVVEIERDGRAYLRFGDDVDGAAPAPGTVFHATWQAGGGGAGNVGHDVLTRLVTTRHGVQLVTNPLPAISGCNPENVEHVRQHAPAAFLTQERAVTAADWREVTLRHPEVQDAAARFRWTGSWWTVFLTVDLVGGIRLSDNPDLASQLASTLDRYRVAGYDLQLRDLVDLAVDLGLHVCVAPDALRVDVEAALLDAFANRDVPGVGRGFFHPDRHTFGQPLYVSQIVARAMAVTGVASVKVTSLHPVARAEGGELAGGRLQVGDLEVVRLDNDPSAPERGVLHLDMEGGL